jgi:hypothetical protein
MRTIEQTKMIVLAMCEEEGLHCTHGSDEAAKLELLQSCLSRWAVTISTRECRFEKDVKHVKRGLVGNGSIETYLMHRSQHQTPQRSV